MYNVHCTCINIFKWISLRSDSVIWHLIRFSNDVISHIRNIIWLGPKKYVFACYTAWLSPMKKCDKKSRVTNEECPLSAVIQSSRLVKQCDSSENLRVQIQKLFCLLFILFYSVSFIRYHLFQISESKSRNYFANFSTRVWTGAWDVFWSTCKK